MKAKYVFKGHYVLRSVHLIIVIRVAKLYEISGDKEMLYTF